jgi:hypothetical protein
VLLSQLDAAKRKAVREELEWQGFGAMGPNLLGCPRSDRADLAATLRELDAEDDSIVFETHAQEVLASKALRAQVRESWNIDELGSITASSFAVPPLWQAMKELEAPDAADCFLARTCSSTSTAACCCAIRNCRMSCCRATGKAERLGNCAATCIGWCRAGQRNTLPLRWRPRTGRCRMPTAATTNGSVG